MDKDNKQVGLNADLASEIEKQSDEAEAKINSAGGEDKEKTEKTTPVSEAPKSDNTVKEKDSGSGAGKVAGIIIACVVGAALVAATIFYFITADKYKTVYYPHTFINGIDASYKTPDQVKSIIAEQCDDYSITFKSRDRDDEVITGDSVGLHYTTDDTPDRILASQNPYLWFLYINDIKDSKITASTEVDPDKFNSVCESLPAFDDSTAKVSVDAKLGPFNKETGRYEIIPEQDGNLIADKEAVKALLLEAVLTLEPELNIDTADNSFYIPAAIRSDNENLKAEQYKYNRYVETAVSFGDSGKVLTGEEINNLLLVRNDGTVSVDEEKLKKYVEKLASELDTVGTTREFITHNGNKAIVEGGTFGYQLDQQAEYDALLGLLGSGESIKHDPVFTQSGKSLSGPDIGNTYVEVSIEEQHVWYFKDGKLLMDTDCVTGLDVKSRYTPDGTFFVYFKQTDRILRGERRPDGTFEYESHVNFWMPFNKGIGLHDATWRGSFGGKIYKTNGSHGCVNLPYKFAKALYPDIEIGCPVIVYSSHIEVPNVTHKPEDETYPQTEEETTTKATKAPAKTKAATQAAPQPVPVETAPAALPETAPVVVPETAANIVTGIHGGPGVTAPQ